MVRTITKLSVVALVAFLFSGTASAEEWGDLKMKFVYDGPPPAAKPVAITKDAQYCGKFNLLEEEWVVSKKNGGISDVLAYIYTRTGPKPAIHPDYQKEAAAEIVIDNNGCRFRPRVVTVRPGQTLVLKNSDSVGHNTKIDTFSNLPINYNLPANSSLAQKYEKEERLAVGMPVSCSIHPWMKAWLLVKDTPYAKVSNEDGELLIKNIPAGKWTFQLWHGANGYVADVKYNGKSTTWKRGRVDITIKPGMNDFGEIKFKLKPPKKKS
jgi:plastocyanin